MAMAPPVSAKARLVARKKRPSVVSSLNGLQFTYEKRPGILFRAGRTTSWYVVALNRRSSSGLAPLGDGTKAAVFRARPVVHPRSPSVSKMRMPLAGVVPLFRSDGVWTPHPDLHLARVKQTDGAQEAPTCPQLLT